MGFLCAKVANFSKFFCLCKGWKTGFQKYLEVACSSRASSGGRWRCLTSRICRIFCATKAAALLVNSIALKPAGLYDHTPHLGLQPIWDPQPGSLART